MTLLQTPTSFRFPAACATLALALLCSGAAPAARAQGTVPTFQHRVGAQVYTLVGRDPGRGEVTTIPTVLVPITLSFEAKKTSRGSLFTLEAGAEVEKVLHSPVFSRFAFPAGGDTQYGDAMLRASFPASSPKAQGWHTLLGQPEIKPISITVPAADGYVLTSRSNGGAIGVVDLTFLQKALFHQIPPEPDKLVIAMTRNTTFYAPRPTLCCSWGTHGVDVYTGNSFVLSTVLDAAPAIVTDRDVQPLTQQLAEFLNDPLHDPLVDGASGNAVPAWVRPSGASDDLSHCVSSMVTPRYLLPPTSTNLINQFPTSPSYRAAAGGTVYHLENVALLPWYTRSSNPTYSFPDAAALPAPARACTPTRSDIDPGPAPTARPVSLAAGPQKHWLIGYWAGYSTARETFRLRDVSPQWDVVIVSFAAPNGKTPDGWLRFQPPAGMSPEEFKSDVRYLQQRGKKVLISIGGGGVVFDLVSASSVGSFVTSMSQIVREYGFDGIDIDIEIPSMLLQPGDTDFRHPVTPTVVHLIEALRALHARLGPKFMVTLVPEGPQVQAGYVAYGGGFGSYLPIAYGIRDFLTFWDVQNYNTPPFEGLDGEIYQMGTVDYYVSQNEMLLQGFDVEHNPALHFPALPPNKVAIGFITGASADVIEQSLSYLITGKQPAGSHYKLRQPGGYPDLLGAMFWSINGDRRNNYRYSNAVGPQLHGSAGSQ